MFNNKLNKKTDGVYTIEEEITLVNGKWEGYLKHSNIVEGSLTVYSGKHFTGERISNFYLSSIDEKPWATYLKVFSSKGLVFVNYETTGDQVDADDINLLQEVVLAVDKRVNNILTTNVDGVNAEEIIDARDGELTLGANIRRVEGLIGEEDSNLVVDVAKNARELQQLSNALSMVNINQEAKQTVEGADVISLPKNAGEGAGTVKVFGVTDELGKSVATPRRIKSVGKNLFDKSKIKKNTSLYANGEIKKVQDDSSISEFIKVSKNTVYSLSDIVFVGEFDENKQFIKRNELSNRFTTTPDTTYVILYKYNRELLVDLMLNKGGLASFSPHKKNNFYINNSKELNGLSNKIKDQLQPNGEGAYELINHVARISIKKEDIVSVNRSLDNYDYAVLKIQGNHMKSNIAQHVKVIGYPDLFSINSPQGQVGVGFPKGTTTEFMKDALKGVGVLYQLATPEIIALSTSGNLTTYPSGTVYFENVIADAGMYTDKFIPLHSYPIQEIESIVKLDELGEEIKLDVSKAVITDNTFTHPDLVKDDIVFVEYYYHSEQPIGTNSVEHYDSRYTIKDSVNGKFYQWNITSTDGVAGIGLEEV